MPPPPFSPYSCLFGSSMSCPTQNKQGGGVPAPLCPPCTPSKRLTDLDCIVYGVVALLDVVLDELQVRRYQNVSKVWVNLLPFDLPGAHASEPLGGLQVELLQFPYCQRGHHPTFAVVKQHRSYHRLVLEHPRHTRRHLLLLEHFPELTPQPPSCGVRHNQCKTDVLNNYGDSMIGCPRTMI